jgi:hypothetical protein
MSAEHKTQKPIYFPATELMAMPPPTVFAELIQRKQQYGPQWLTEQMLRLHRHPEFDNYFDILDRTTTFKDMARAVTLKLPQTIDVASNLQHIRAESHAILCRLEAKQYRQEAAANLSMYNKLKKNITALLNKK